MCRWGRQAVKYLRASAAHHTDHWEAAYYAVFGYPVLFTKR